jgi:hypothetical protein
MLAFRQLNEVNVAAGRAATNSRLIPTGTC